MEHFEVADIKYIPRKENQEANELAQIASGYKMSKLKFQDMIEVREKMVSDAPPLTEDILDGNYSHDEGDNEEFQEACGVKNS